jgi:DNA invertase Pin-like site-specific DNA recombinase
MTQTVMYLRVSGDSQIHGDGFPRQREACQKLAEARSMEIVTEFLDEGVTGKMELEGRTGLSACIAYVREHGITTVLCESSDRLARDMIVAEIIVREFQKIGVRVIAAASGIDLTEGDDSNPTAKLIRQILAAVSEFDRCVINLKLKAARQRIKAEGRAPGTKNYSADETLNRNSEGRKPFGQKDGEAPILQKIRNLRSQGKDSGTIAFILNVSGNLSRYGKPWRPGTISKILSRDRKAA